MAVFSQKSSSQKAGDQQKLQSSTPTPGAASSAASKLSDRLATRITLRDGLPT